MPLPVVTPEDLIERYPVFAGQSLGLIGALLEEARGAVSDTWIEADQKPALLAYAAHFLAEAVIDSTVATNPTDGSISETTGKVERIEVGDVRVQYAKAYASTQNTQAKLSAVGGLSSTQYGRRYLELLRRSNPPVMIA